MQDIAYHNISLLSSFNMVSHNMYYNYINILWLYLFWKKKIISIKGKKYFHYYFPSYGVKYITFQLSSLKLSQIRKDKKNTLMKGFLRKYTIMDLNIKDNNRKSNYGTIVLLYLKFSTITLYSPHESLTFFKPN